MCGNYCLGFTYLNLFLIFNLIYLLEVRLRQEQEDKERQEREKQFEEERKKREAKVNEIKSRELYTFYDLLSEINLKLENYHKNRREKIKVRIISF